MSQTTTLSNIRSRVRLRLDDDSFEATAIDRAINDYQSDLTNRHEFTFMETLSTLALGQDAYTMSLPNDCQRLLALILIDPIVYRANYTNKYIDYNNFVDIYPTPDLTSSNIPNQWTIFAQQVRWSAPANAEYSFRIEYLKAAIPLTTDDSVTIIPDEFCEILVEGALVRLQKRDDDYDLANNERGDLLSMETALIGRYARGQTRRGPRRMMSPFRG